MTDIVERIAKAIVSSQPSYSRLDMDGAHPMAKQAFFVMADEIERLRAALERLAELDEFVCGKPQTIEEVMNYTQFVARAALGEKE